MTNQDERDPFAPVEDGETIETASPAGRGRRRLPSLPAALSGVALAAAAAALAVALTGGGSSQPAAEGNSGSATPVAAQESTEPDSTGSEGAAADASTAEAVYAEAAAGVVEVSATGALGSGQSHFGGPDGEESQALGTGFVIDVEGHIVTNEHVVGGADSVTVAFADGTELSARVVGTDPSSDIALLQVDASAVDLHPLELGSSADLSVGQEVFALGNPYGLDRSLTSGIISALDRQIQAPNGYAISGTIQTDAAINSGNSGGPLLDADGKVIGVTAQIESQTGGNVGIGYAIPVDLVEEVIGQLESGGAVEHAYLGVSIEQLTSSLAESLGVEDGEGVHVAEVRDGSPADDAGLQGGDSGQGDVIVSVDGRAVDSPEALTALIASRKPGDRVELEIVRDGETMTVTATLGTRPESVEG